MSLAGRVLGRIERETRAFRHAGGRFRCAVCERPVKSFEPLDPALPAQWRAHGFDLDPRRFETLNVDSYSCPLCGASDRDRLYAMYIEEFARTAPATGRSVEFAPTGPLGAKLARALHGWTRRTADLFMPGVDDRVDLCDMRNVYADASVDFFVCSHVLEHVADDWVAMAELFRVLKPGGCGIAMAPVHLDIATTRVVPQGSTDADHWRIAGQDDHVRLHAPADFRALIANAGFEALALGADHFGAAELARNGISAGSILHVARKPKDVS